MCRPPAASETPARGSSLLATGGKGGKEGREGKKGREGSGQAGLRKTSLAGGGGVIQGVGRKLDRGSIFGDRPPPVGGEGSCGAGGRTGRKDRAREQGLGKDTGSPCVPELASRQQILGRISSGEQTPVLS